MSFGCCIGGMCYHTYKHAITHVIVYFDCFGAFLDLGCSLGFVKVSSVGCMLYVDDVLLCKL